VEAVESEQSPTEGEGKGGPNRTGVSKILNRGGRNSGWSDGDQSILEPEERQAKASPRKNAGFTHERQLDVVEGVRIASHHVETILDPPKKSYFPEIQAVLKRAGNCLEARTRGNRTKILKEFLMRGEKIILEEGCQTDNPPGIWEQGTHGGGKLSKGKKVSSMTKPIHHASPSRNKWSHASERKSIPEFIRR